MKNYDLTKINLFSIENLKRGELSNIHSVLLFLYGKFNGNEEVSFKYAEIGWLNYNLVFKIILKLNELSIIDIVKRPTIQDPFVVRIKPNNELHYILNKNNKIYFHKYNLNNFTRKEFKEVLDCLSISEHFILSSVTTWLRNLQNGHWNLYEFLTLCKIITYFNCDTKVKTFTVNKYAAKSMPFPKAIKFLYEKIPDHRKEIIYSQINNTLLDLSINHDKSFFGMVSKYMVYLKKGPSIGP